MFFLALAALVGGIGWTIKNQTSFASGQPVTISQSTHQLSVSLNVKDHGVGFVDGLDIGTIVSFFRDRDELNYLMLKQPNVSIAQLRVDVHFPRPVLSPDAIHPRAIVVYNDSLDYQISWTDSTTLTYQFANLGPAASVTILAELPKGIIQPSLNQQLFGSIRSLPQIIWLALAVILPLLGLLILAIVLLPQLRARSTEAVRHERPTPPSALPPGVVEALVTGRVSARGIAATLLDLSQREYLEIGSYNKTYTFTKRRRLLATGPNADLAPFEKLLIEKFLPSGTQATVADVRVRIGNSIFSRKVAEIYLAIYEIVTQRGFFADNPSMIHGTYRLAGLMFFFIGLIGFGFGVVFFADPPMPLLFWVGLILSGLVIVGAAPHMPAQTDQGLRARREWIAFRNYLKSTQTISFSAQNQQEFYTYLPYAVALGVEVAWARRFLMSSFTPPPWYSSARPIVQLDDFLNDVFPLVGFLSQEFAAVREPTLT